jgi:hypothetical protein
MNSIAESPAGKQGRAFIWGTANGKMRRGDRLKSAEAGTLKLNANNYQSSVAFEGNLE